MQGREIDFELNVQLQDMEQPRRRNSGAALKDGEIKKKTDAAFLKKSNNATSFTIIKENLSNKRVSRQTLCLFTSK